MEPLEIDLEIGETLYVGNFAVTLLDTDGDRVDVRIDSRDEFDFDPDGASPMN